MAQLPIIVIGAGISGLAASLRLAEAGVPVTLVTLAPLGVAQSAGDASGFNAVMNPGDTVEAHLAETVEHGGLLANQELVRQMVTRSVFGVHMLERLGVPFDRTSEGFPAFSQSTGNFKARTLKAGAFTGKQILNALESQVRRRIVQGLITLYEGWEFVSLIRNGQGRVAGVVVCDQRTTELKGLPAASLIFCTGGFGGLFDATLRSQSLLGSATAILFREGLNLANLEFVEEKPHPFTLGGLWVDERQATNLPGIFAAGKCQHQYHGARLLEGNRLPASLAGGLKAAQSALTLWQQEVVLPPDLAEMDAAIRREHEIHLKLRQSPATGENVFELQAELATCLSQTLTGPRRHENLLKSLNRLDIVRDRLKNLSLADRSTWVNQELSAARAIPSLLELAYATIMAMLARKESRGAHVRADYPQRDDHHYLKQTRLSWQQHSPLIEYEDVNLKYVGVKDHQVAEIGGRR